MIKLLYSPSGNLYGSERTALNIAFSGFFRTFYVNVQNSQLLHDKASQLDYALNPCTLKKFRGVWGFVLAACVNSLSAKCCHVVNEAGYIRYTMLLASFFRQSEFVIFVRIAEDVARLPIKENTRNVTLVFVSELLKDRWHKRGGKGFGARVVYDFHEFDSIPIDSKGSAKNQKVFGIVGRLSESKGLEHLTRILGIMADFPKEFLSDVVINHFGDVAIESESNRKDFENAIAAFTKRGGRFIFRGFQSRELIYSEVETIVHFAMDEPFGLIFLEALASRRNFVGFKGGGIAEIASKIGAENLLVELGDYKAFGEAMLFSRMSGAEMDVYRTNCAKAFSKTQFYHSLQDLLSS